MNENEPEKPLERNGSEADNSVEGSGVEPPSVQSEASDQTDAREVALGEDEVAQPTSAQSTADERAPVGWYPTPDGGQRYWDGARWLDLPDPAAARATTDAVPGAASVGTSRRRKLITAAIIGALAVVLIGGGLLAWKVVSDGEAARVAAEEAAEAAREREAEAEREKEREEAAERAAEAEDDAERETRAAAVPGIEESVKVMAEEHAADGVIDGPILSVSCSPVQGGSIDDLSELTTVFECFVATVDNGDGTMTGYTYNATMNWSTGSYTYGLGAP
ncbi:MULTISPECIES: DUF2510 domain-containing protein [unclassified Agromyces]|uniref:DUF2510 domain-containing protein n=1 Tax=unclassified Agromyces TaxID=2639701 RepID=UPI0030151EFC